MTPTTTTGDPNAATVLLLGDLSTNAGGGADDDDIPEGPVVDENVKVVVYESGSTTNLLGTATTLKTNTTYKVLLWKDKTVTAPTIPVKTLPAITTTAGNLPATVSNWARRAVLSAVPITTPIWWFRLPMPKRRVPSTTAKAVVLPLATMACRVTDCLSIINANNTYPTIPAKGWSFHVFCLANG